MAVTSLNAEILADLSNMMDETYGFAVEVTRADLTTFSAIFVDGFDDVDDPRAPQMVCEQTALTSMSHGDGVTVNGVNYTMEGYQPDGAGGAIVMLTQL